MVVPGGLKFLMSEVPLNQPKFHQNPFPHCALYLYSQCQTDHFSWVDACAGLLALKKQRPPGTPFNGAMPRVLGDPRGGGAHSYERGTPITG